MNLENFDDLIADIETHYFKWRRATAPHARNRNMLALVDNALDLRELISQYPPQNTYGLIHQLQGEMNVHQIISKVLLHGFYDDEVFRAVVRKSAEDRIREKEAERA